MNRIVKIAINEILADPGKSSDILNNACSREGMKVSGLVGMDNTVLVELVKSPDNARIYRFAEFERVSEDDVAAEINTRMNSGFITEGGFFAGEQLWGLFSRQYD